MERMCPNCGAVLKEGQSFCTQCGQIVQGSQQQAPQYPPQSQQYAPQSQQYAQQNQQYAPQNQQYAPQSQQYAPQNQQYAPQSQQYAPQTPQYPPQNQQYAQQAPQYPPQGQPSAPPKKKSKAPILITIVALVCVAAVAAVYFLFLRQTPVDRIELATEELTMAVGDTQTVDYEIRPKEAEDAELTWESDNEDVVTVRNGKLKAVGTGSCTVTVSAESGAEAELTVTVKKALESIELSPNQLSLREGKTWMVSYTLSPLGALEPELTWQSDDESVATVEDGLVTAVGEGECRITLSASNGVTAYCDVTVDPPVTEEIEMVVGDWSVYMLVSDEYGATPYHDNTVYLTINADQSGILCLEDEIYTFTYDFLYIDEDGDYDYVMTLDDTGEEYYFYYIADPTTESLIGDLWLILDSGSMMIFER